MRTIFLDESGYTGSDYLDKHKLLFVVASLAIEPDVAHELKQRYFGNVGSAELKHSQLMRRPNQRTMVLDFLAHLATVPHTSKIWLADKRFAAWLKVVDHIIEPFLYNQGHNLYQNGANVAMATMLLGCVPAFTSDDYTLTLLERAIGFIKTGNAENRASLVEWLERGKAAFGSSDTREVLDYMLVPLQVLRSAEYAVPPQGAADMAFGAALQLMGWWRTDIREPIHLVHDATANMARQKEIWDAITAGSLPPARSFRASSGMVLTFPIGVEKTTFARSQDHDGLQLADVLAGAIGCSFDRRLGGERADYANAVLEHIGIGKFAVHAVIPPADISPKGMGTANLDGNEPLDYLTMQAINGRIPRPRKHTPQREK